MDYLDDADEKNRSVFDDDGVVKPFVGYNVIFTILGLSMLIVGFQLLVASGQAGASSITATLNLLSITVGACMVCHSVFGIVGAVYKYAWVLKIYFVILLVIFIVTFICTGFAFTVQEDAKAYYKANWATIRDLFPKGTTLQEAEASLSVQLAAMSAGSIITLCFLFVGLLGSAKLLQVHRAGALVVGVTNLLVLPVSVSLFVWGGYLLAYAQQTPFIIMIINGCMGLAIVSMIVNIIGSLGVATRAKTICLFFIALLVGLQIVLLYSSSSLMSGAPEWAIHIRRDWYEFYRTPFLSSYLNVSPEEFLARIQSEVRLFGCLFLVMLFLNIFQIIGAFAVIVNVHGGMSKELGLSALYRTKRTTTNDETGSLVDVDEKSKKRVFNDSMRRVAKRIAIFFGAIILFVIILLLWTAYPAYCHGINAFNALDTVYNSTVGDIRRLLLANNFSNGQVRITTATLSTHEAATGDAFRLEKELSCSDSSSGNYSASWALSDAGILSMQYSPKRKNPVLGVDVSCQYGTIIALVSPDYHHLYTGYRLALDVTTKSSGVYVGQSRDPRLTLHDASISSYDGEIAVYHTEMKDSLDLISTYGAVRVQDVLLRDSLNYASLALQTDATIEVSRVFLDRHAGVLDIQGHSGFIDLKHVTSEATGFTSEGLVDSVRSEDWSDLFPFFFLFFFFAISMGEVGVVALVELYQH